MMPLSGLASQALSKVLRGLRGVLAPVVQAAVGNNTAKRSAVVVLLISHVLVFQASAGKSEPRLPNDARVLYGQLLILGFTGTKPGDAGVERAAKDLKEGLAGGLIFFDRNIVDGNQLRRLLAYFRQAGGPYPPFLAVDEEGGAVQRLVRRKGFRGDPAARWVAANKSPPEARGLYSRMAATLAELGFNLNLAPVVDLDLNPTNPVIGRLGRSFGKDPEQVARYAGAFVDGHREHGVLTALKHWPGHGSSRGDPHFTLADASGGWDARERQPFAMLLKAAKVDMIMTGHLHHRDWAEGDGRPASLSPTAVQHDLRKTLGFGGVVITDDIQMSSAVGKRSLADAIVLALDAGNDIVLIANMLPPRPVAAREAVEAIEQAVARGRLDRQALEASYLRVMALKGRLQP